MPPSRFALPLRNKPPFMQEAREAYLAPDTQYILLESPNRILDASAEDQEYEDM